MSMKSTWKSTYLPLLILLLAFGGGGNLSAQDLKKDLQKIYQSYLDRTAYKFKVSTIRIMGKEKKTEGITTFLKKENLFVSENKDFLVVRSPKRLLKVDFVHQLMILKNATDFSPMIEESLKDFERLDAEQPASFKMQGGKKVYSFSTEEQLGLIEIRLSLKQQAIDKVEYIYQLEKGEKPLIIQMLYQEQRFEEKEMKKYQINQFVSCEANNCLPLSPYLHYQVLYR